VVTILTTLLNNQKLCPQSDFQNFVRFLQNTVLPLTTLTQLHLQAYLYTLLLQIKVITGMHLYNKQILLEVILLPSVNHTVKLHNLVRSLPLCNVTQCCLLVTDVLGLIVHPETSVTNYRSMLPNIPEEWKSHYTTAEASNRAQFSKSWDLKVTIWRPVKYFLLIHRQGIQITIIITFSGKDIWS
jgi:hypothetical protein